MEQEQPKPLSPHTSHNSTTLLNILLGIAVAVLVFAAGISLGFHRAEFAHNWSESYEHNFVGHGAAGKIVQIEPPNVFVMDRDGTEKVIVIGNETIIRKDAATISINDLSVNDDIVVIGSPNTSGQIEARIVRVMTSELPLLKQ